MGQKLFNRIKGLRHREKPMAEKGAEGGFSTMLAYQIIKKRGFIEILFAIGCLFSLLAMLFVDVNYDLTKYVPKSAVSAQGLDKMKEVFGYPGTARVMIKDVSLYEAKQYKEKFEAVDGVDQVLWCDTTVNVYAGEDFINMDDIKDYYKDNCAVMDITFDEESDSNRTKNAITELKEITGDKGCFSGMAIQNKSLIETTASEMQTILVVAVIMIFAVLALTTTAWTEPILFMLVMGVAVLLNRGTNIFIGTVSFLTNNVAIILQLATSMDYSIFLLDAFLRWRNAGFSEEEAIVKAVEEAINSIFASSLTTVVGFLALVTMKFNIGFDMGLVLAKGIICSLLAVVFFMPAMILKFAKWNDKTRHRSFLPNFTPLGKLVYKVRYVILALVIVLTPPAYVAQGMNDFLFGNDAVGSSEGTKVYEDDQEIVAKFGRSNMLLAIYPNTSNVTEKELTDELEDLPYVKSVTSMAGTLPEGVPEDIIPYSTAKLLHRGDTARMLIYIRTKGESDASFEYTDQIREIVKKYYPDNSYLVGETPSTQDIKSTITDDNARVNMLTLLGVFLVVAFSFKSVLIPIVVMIPIEVAIFVNMAVPYVQGVDMIYMGYIIVSSIQMGATVDYSILLTNNYIAKRATLPKKEACIEAVTRSCSSIFTSGGIITLAGYIVYMISTTAAIGDLGHLIGRGGFLSLILVLTLLPALLVLTDGLIIEKKWKGSRRRIRERYVSRRQQFHARAEQIRTKLEEHRKEK